MRFLTEREREALRNICPEGTAEVYSEAKVFECAQPTTDVSIIVPCYNAEAYIGECMDSLCGQKADCSIEVIAVNDGSTDGTEAVLRGYEARYPNLRVITQENGGPGRARNTGMRVSEGRYLAFVDADDRVPENYIRELYRAARTNDADLAACGYLTFLEDGRVIKRVMPNGDRDRDILIGTPWAKLFARELFAHLLWPEKSGYQDTIIGWLVFPRIRRLVTTDKCCYEYRSNAAGITRGTKAKLKAVQTMYMTDSVMRVLERFVPADWCGSEAYYRFLIDQLYLNHYRVISLDKGIRRLVFDVQSRFLKESGAGEKAGACGHGVYAAALRRGSFQLGELAVKGNRPAKLLRMLKAKLKRG